MKSLLKCQLSIFLFFAVVLLSVDAFSWCEDKGYEPYTNFYIEKNKGSYYIYPGDGQRLGGWDTAEKGGKYPEMVWIITHENHYKKGNSAITEYSYGWIVVCKTNDGYVRWYWQNKNDVRDEDPGAYGPVERPHHDN